MSQTEELEPIVLGNPVRATVKFKSKLTGLPAEPTLVVLYLLDPKSNRTKPTPIRVPEGAEGEWFYEWVPGLPGPWRGRFVGTGALYGAQKFVVNIEDSEP